MSDLPEKIGGCTVVRELGRGGMGVVYLADDTKLARDVAVKALPDEVAADAGRLERFHREAKLLASVSHPNIAGVYGLEETDGHTYLVLEYVEGEELAERLDRGPLPLEEALEAAAQIAAALEAAHGKGVVHRDLKPANIKLTPDGTVKVLDFGLAKAIGEVPSSVTKMAESPTIPYAPSPTMPGVILGTAGYMSPEQARGRPVDKRCDVFSFGCVLYEMLSGAPPFPGETVTDSIGATLHVEPDLDRLPPGTPPDIRHLIERCLVKDRRRRLQDIADARIELEDVGQKIASGIIRPAALAATRSGRHPRLWPAVAGVLALAVVGLLLRDAIVSSRPQTLDTGPSVVAMEQLTDLPGEQSRPSLSPNGRQLLYNDVEGGDWDIFLGRRLTCLADDPNGEKASAVYDLSSGETTLLHTPGLGYHAGAVGQAWLDEDRFMFWDWRRRKVFLWNVATGAAREVPDVQGPGPIHCNDDGRTLIVNRFRTESDIWLLSLSE